MSELNEILSEREREILRLVATGAPNKEIARQLVISPNTVKVHLRNIFTKIGVSTRTEATLYAVQIGLVNPTAVESPLIGASAEEDLEGPALEGGEQSVDPESLVRQSVAPEAGQLAQGKPAAPRVFSRAALLIAAVLILTGAGIMAVRFFNPLRIDPAAAQQATQPGFVIQRWTAQPGLPEARKGMGAAEYENGIYLIGGETDRGIDGAVLRLDPTAASWEKLADKPNPVTDVQAALLAEKIYVPGGVLQNGAATNMLEIYDPRTNQWETGAPLPKPISAYALAAFEGRLYLFGGKSGEQTLSDVYVYEPEAKEWAERSPMDTPRAFARAVVQNGKIYVLGGFDGRRALDLNQAYLPNRDAAGENAWETYAPLPEGRYAMGSAALASIIYVAGGVDSRGRPLDAPALQYEVQADQWDTFDAPPEIIGAHPAVQGSGNFLFVLGGETPRGLSKGSFSYQAIYTIAVPILRNDGADDPGGAGDPGGADDPGGAEITGTETPSSAGTPQP